MQRASVFELNPGEAKVIELSSPARLKAASEVWLYRWAAQ